MEKEKKSVKGNNISSDEEMFKNLNIGLIIGFSNKLTGSVNAAKKGINVPKLKISANDVNIVRTNRNEN